MKQLLEEIYDLYNRYPAELITEAIRQYRKEQELEKEVNEIDTKITELKTRRRQLKPEEKID